MWPKAVGIDMVENAYRTAIGSYDNLHVVLYKEMRHTKKDYGINAKNPMELVSPFQTLRNLAYRNLEAYAHAEVAVRSSDNRAIVTLRDPALIRKPSKILNKFVNHPVVVVATGITTLYLLKRYPVSYAYGNIKRMYHNLSDRLKNNQSNQTK